MKVETEMLDPELRECVRKLKDAELDKTHYVDGPNISMVKKSDVDSQLVKEWLKRSDDIPADVFEGIPSIDVRISYVDSIVDELGADFAYDVFLKADGFDIARLDMLLQGNEFDDVIEFECGVRLERFEYLID